MRLYLSSLVSVKFKSTVLEDTTILTQVKISSQSNSTCSDMYGSQQKTKICTFVLKWFYFIGHTGWILFIKGVDKKNCIKYSKLW